VKKLCLSIIVIAVLAAGSALASGFRIPEQGAKAMGMANAWVAQADDATAIYFNPAGIAQIGRPDANVGVTFVAPGITHTTSKGAEVDAESNLFLVPNVNATCNMGTSNWAFGIGVSAPFGLGTEWADDSFARYASTETTIQLIDVNPTLAYKFNDAFFLGVGLDYYSSTVTIKKRVPWGALSYQATKNPALLAVPDGGFQLKGDGDGWGYNAGILYKFDKNYTFGMAYRSGFTVKYEGDADLTDIGGVGLVKYRGKTFTTPGNAELKYPGVLQMGFAARVVPKLLLEADIEWTDWSTYKQLAINFDSPLVADTVNIKDWKDTWTIRIGGDYAFSEAFHGRLGYLYDQSPVSSDHYDTLLPDGKARHGFSIGAGYVKGKFSVDAAYMGLFNTERTITKNNPDYPLTDLTGKYSGFTSLFGINAAYQF
jgi:long-chain fatty acid transport protein